MSWRLPYETVFENLIQLDITQQCNDKMHMTSGLPCHARDRQLASMFWAICFGFVQGFSPSERVPEPLSSFDVNCSLLFYNKIRYHGNTLILYCKPGQKWYTSQHVTPYISVPILTSFSATQFQTRGWGDMTKEHHLSTKKLIFGWQLG